LVTISKIAFAEKALALGCWEQWRADFLSVSDWPPHLLPPRVVNHPSTVDEFLRGVVASGSVTDTKARSFRVKN
jgi:hypothetical protein